MIGVGAWQVLVSEGKEKTRARVACLPCKLGKRKCDCARPCGACIIRSLESKCVDGDKPTACAYCVRRKIKCDKQRPCSRCIATNRTDDCVQGIVTIGRSSLTACSDDSCPDSNAMSQSRDSDASPAEGNSMLPSRTKLGCIVVPETPIPFPDSFQRSTTHAAHQGLAKHPYIPFSLFRWYASYSISPRYVHNLYHHTTPKLRDVITQIFGVADRACELAALKQSKALADAAAQSPPLATAAPSAPQRPGEFLLEQAPSWWDSGRCGMYKMTVTCPMELAGAPRLDRLEANGYWAGLAGLHREELFARLLAEELPPFTSELRLLCRLLVMAERLFRGQQGLISREEYLRENVVYGRFSRCWGRTLGRAEKPEGGGERGGLLTRMRYKRILEEVGSAEARGSVCWSVVVLTEREYDAALAQQPEACEPLAAEVLGPLSGRELLDPELDQRESLASLNACAEGRAALDRLADILRRRFDFLLAAGAMLQQAAGPRPSPA